MKGMLSRIKRISRTQIIYGAVLLVALVGGWYFFFRPVPAVQSTLVLAPKPFLQQVSVSGKVVAAKEVDLGFSQSGRITGVYASVGDHVAEGTTLAVVENGDLRAALLQRQAALENQQARLASLKAGTRPEEVAIAQSAVDRDTQGLINAIADAYRAADGAVHNTMDQFISNPRTNPVITFQVSDSNLKTSAESARFAAESMLAQWGSEVSGLGASSDLSAAASRAQSDLSAIVSLLSDANAVINRGIPNTQTSQAALDSYGAAVSAARSSVNASVSAVTAARSALDSSKKTLALKQAGPTDQDIAAQEAQVKSAEADVAAAQAQLQKTIIAAPFSGTVTSVDAKVGQAVSPNTPEVSMISAGAFQIESYVPEVNIAVIKVGNSATVTLDAYGDNTTFAAKVVSIDPASTVRDGVSTYRIVLEFIEADDRVKAGMTANVSIATAQKDSVLSIPQALVVYRDGKAYVQVAEGALTQEREVTVGGVSSLGDIEILSGLSAGDVVILSKP